MKPQIEYFEETREVRFAVLNTGDKFTSSRGERCTMIYDRDGNRINAVTDGYEAISFIPNDLVTIHRPLETKPLGECEPGDVFTISGDTEVFRKLTPDPFGRPGWGYMRESDSKLVYFDRAIVVTIIGKVVCDG